MMFDTEIAQYIRTAAAEKLLFAVGLLFPSSQGEGEVLMANKIKICACALMLTTMLSVTPRTAEAALFNTPAALEASVDFAQSMVFDPVGLLVGTDANGNDFGAGTGVLIDPYWVLTAGHVPFDEPRAYFKTV